jgi:hypothetical protein
LQFCNQEDKKILGTVPTKLYGAYKQAKITPSKGFFFLKEGNIPFKYYWISKRIPTKVWKYYIIEN